MKENNTRPMRLALQYFAEGTGDGGGGNAGSAAGAEGTEAAQTAPGRYRGTQSAGPGREGAQEKGTQGPSGMQEASGKEAAPKYKNVRRELAKEENPSSASAQGEETGGEALDAEFESLIRGKYRDAWQKRADAIVNRRFAQTRALQETQAALAPLLDRLAQRFSVRAGDIQGLMKALESEAAKAPANFPAVEENGGMDFVSDRVQEMNQARSSQREMQAALERRQRVNAIHQRWREEVKQARAVYPGLDFKKESQNPDFARLVTTGIPVRHAYEVIHRDEILGGAMHYTAQKTREKLAADIAARGMRPAENGVTGQTAMVPGFRYEHLSKAAKAEIERRALRGERVNPRDYMDYR